MHIDARELANNSIIEGDICIIGAGAAGISIALDWLKTPYKVILLEGGGFEYDDEVQNLYEGKTTGQKYYPLKSGRLHYFGGTTGHWGGMCSPLDEIDFKERHWIENSGWPINKQDLDPFYEKANKVLELGPYNYDFSYWNKNLPNLIPFPLNKKVIWNKMWQYSKARFGRLYKETIIEAKKIHLYTYANAVDVKTESNLSVVNEVIVKNHFGKIHTVKAKHFIMACGTIQNARMLLSSNSQTPKGLGNENDLVGRYFQEHLEVASAELWLEKPFKTDLYSWEYGVTKASAELAFTEEVQFKEEILNGTISLQPLSVAKYLKPKLHTWKDGDPRNSLEVMMNDLNNAEEKALKEKGNITYSYQLNTRIEQAPNPNSRVTIVKERDELGVPRASLNWELTSLEKYSIRRMYQILGQQMGVFNIGRIKLNEFLRDETNNSLLDDTVNGGWHHMGTTRMSIDPKKGVVDVNCKVHGITNLFIAGAACFPTSGAPNPTLTLVALSLRLSDYIKKLI
ncbi:GMC family oxidoreductase [Gaetbulibacter sp. M235]|uniref:GMC oxidoreductase n=1 Tax=Gaetbulibacter sp. M235 TaxID=3126510 RepID=UPI00374E7790